jgi:hypothetical protein
MRTEKKVSQGDGYGRAGCPAKLIVKQVCGLCSSLKSETPFLLRPRAASARASSGRLKISLDPHKESRVVLIRWLQAGQRTEETVPVAMARHRRNELEAQGAVVYWSERLGNAF